MKFNDIIEIIDEDFVDPKANKIHKWGRNVEEIVGQLNSLHSEMEADQNAEAAIVIDNIRDQCFEAREKLLRMID